MRSKTAIRILGLSLSAVLLNSLIIPAVPRWSAGTAAAAADAGIDQAAEPVSESNGTNPIAEPAVNPAPGSTVNLASTPAVTQLNPIEDTYVNAGGNASKNFGSSNVLAVKNYDIDVNLRRQAFMKYDLSSFTGEIGSAKLKIYAVDGENSTIGVQAYGMEDDSWQETAATWNNKPAYEHYLAELNVGKTASWYEIDVTAFVKKQKALDGKASFAFIQQAAKGHAVTINSRENTANRPYLELSAERANGSAPSWPAGSTFSASNASATSLQLNWTAATDPAGVTGYTVYRNGSAVGTVAGTATSYTVTGLQADSSYTFKVEAGNAPDGWSSDGPYLTLTMPNPNRTVLPPAEDTYVQGGGNQSKNFGAQPTLLIKNFNADQNLNRQAYMKYDLSLFPGEIGSAKLKMYAVDGENSTIGVQAYGMENDTWKELTVTWNDKPAIDHYMGSVNVGKTAAWYEYDVTAFVKRQAALDGTASFALVEQAAAGHAVSVNSRENGVNRPYLELSVNRANGGAPSWPGGSAISVSDITETGLQLNWSSAADPAGVTGYTVYQNGNVIAAVGPAATSLAVTGLQVGQRYTFKVEAGNALNQWSNDGPFATAETPTTKLIQVRPGNVFTDGEPIGFKVRTARPAVTWAVYDYQGALVSEGAAPSVQNEAAWTVPFTKYGYFMLQVKAELTGSEPVSIKSPFAVMPPLDPSGNEGSPFGMSTHLHRFPTTMTADIVNLMKEAGMRLVRGGFEWPGIEKQPGTYTFGPQPDYYMNMLDSEYFDFLYVSGYTNPNYDNNSTPYTDAGREAFANYMKAYVDHYEGQMDALEVYNEFYGSFGDRGNGPADSKPEYYYPLLKKSYETIKAAYPDLPVLGTSTVGDLKWIEDVLKLGGMSYMDGFSIHPYLYPNAPEGYDSLIDNVKTLIRTYNNGNLKPIWINETGWPTQLDARGVDEKTQADYLIRAYVVALANGVEKIVWYDLINDGLTNVNEDNFGLLRNPNDKLGSLTPKPAYSTYAAMTRKLNNASFVRRDATDSDIRSYLFDKNGEDVRVLWTTSPSVPAVIRTSSPIRISDMMGNTHTYVPDNGSVYVTLSGEPYFVEGELTAIEKDATFVLTGQSARVGDSMTFALKTDNASSSAFTYSLDVEGELYPVVTASGQQTVQTIDVSNANQPGTRQMTGFLMKGSDKIGLLRSSAKALPPYEVQVRPVITDPDTLSKSLLAGIKNESQTKPLQVKRVEWRFGTQSGTKELNAAVPAGSSVLADIPLTGFGLGASSTIKVTVYFDGFEPYTYEGTAEFNPVLPRTVTVDGALDPETAAVSPSIDLSKGTVKMTGYQGAGDLSGSVWLNYDSSHLYLTAKIKDDTFSATSSGADIWKNDAIQFAIASGLPGESPYWYEYGISQTPEGPQIYRWITPPGVAKGAVTNGRLSVTREEAQDYTIYELALPWSEVAPAKAAKNEVMSFSIVVNDNDGTGRKGWIEWGGGIGDGKLSSKFRTFQWIVTDDIPPTTVAAIEGAQRNGWYVSDVTVKLNATDDKSGVTETVYSLDGGATWAAYRGAIAFKEDGVRTLTFRSTDGMGNAEQPQTAAFRIDRTAPTVLISGGGTYDIDQHVTVTCTAADTVSGVVYSSCSAPLVNSPAYRLNIGDNPVSAGATDAAGNSGTAETTVTVKVTLEGLIRLIKSWITGNGSQGIVNSLETKLRHEQFHAFANEVRAQKGKKIPEEAADILLKLVDIGN
ncbi:DNRLRE domain-containing protein [Paenibacillus sp. MBLB4367]|uniref:CBM96 family carbohydrate-binding protein n=1 Tax=Paenibacillus sp. MBLB4367 TaxID=3384767 RepID=UPI00390825BB